MGKHIGPGTSITDRSFVAAMLHDPENCARCRFWIAVLTSASTRLVGECRRNPPQLATVSRPFFDLLHRHATLDADTQDSELGITPEHYGTWPLTFRNDVCGEFQRRGAV